VSQVPIQRTPVAMSDYARALLKAWRSETGDLPTKQAAGVLWAQYMIETGGAACWCFNLGNLKVTQAQVDAGVPWFDLPGTWEIVNGKRVVLPEGDPGRRFRAYASLDEAMVEHMRLLRNRRYKAAWPAVETGDVMAFARLLKAGGYFTASAEDYGGGMMWHYRKWLSSTVYENARDGIEMLQAAETKPDLGDEPDPDSTRVIHPAIDFPPRVVRIPGDDEPPPEAA
jgi:hypothetical protein